MSMLIPFMLVGAAILFMRWVWADHDTESMIVSAVAAFTVAAALLLFCLGVMIWC